MKTLAHGLPMVLIPWGRDQPGVAARVEAAGAAIVVPRDRCTDERVAAAIREVLTQPRYAVASSAIAARMRDNDAIATASAAIDELLTNRALNAR
jgi:UDP:flavonoid glycosyltransferase YjiC (YdhE family)